MFSSAGVVCGTSILRRESGVSLFTFHGTDFEQVQNIIIFHVVCIVQPLTNETKDEKIINTILSFRAHLISNKFIFFNK